MKKIILLLFNLLFILFISSSSHFIFASTKIFEDNFDQGNYDKWKIAYNTCYFNGSPALWEILNGKMGIKINEGSCITDAIPKDEYWDSVGNDYSVEFDMTLVSGIDHNFAFRYTEGVGWYGIHIQSPNRLILQNVLNTDKYNNIVSGNFDNGQTIHFKIEIIGNHIKIYRGIPLELILDYPDAGWSFPSGKIDLQASDSDYDPTHYNETWFDNVVVRSIDPNILDVPYFNQNTPPWGPSEYDSAKSLGFLNTTMDRWGCAVTSAAMVLNYHGMNKLLDGTPLDPGSLNTWLENNKGYVTGYGRDGPYSYLDWPVISDLTKQLYAAGLSTIKLEHKRTNSENVLRDDLTLSDRKFPDILWVKNASTSGHFVVATGVLNNSYAINDPEWNVTDLSSFGNNFMQIDRYVPANSDLSYIVAVVNPHVDILLTDSNGNKAGKYDHDGISENFSDIPDATYSYEEPIGNPNGSGIIEKLGTGVNVLLLPQPDSQKYKLTVSSSEKNDYTINIVTFREDGKFEVNKYVGTVDANSDNNVEVDYSKIDTSSIIRDVNFDTLIDDIQILRRFNSIDSDHLANHLTNIIEQAQKDNANENLKLSFQKIGNFDKTLNNQINKGLTQDAFDILIYDSTVLQNSLNFPPSSLLFNL